MKNFCVWYFSFGFFILVVEDKSVNLYCAAQTAL